MIIVLSPAKSLDFESPLKTDKNSQPRFTDESEKLVSILKKKSVRQLKSMMNISEDLAQLNADRFQSWKLPLKPPAARPAVFAFTGDVYQGLEAKQFTEKQLDFAQDHLRILSGLYGVLRPLDLMLPYRLEMGTKLKVTPKKDNLYKFWDNSLTEQINKDLEASNSKALINLASNEYFKALNSKLINQPVITPEFKDYKNGEYKMIGFFAKRARGLMAAHIVRKKLTDPEKLKTFASEGYTYNDKLSKGNKWVFTRENQN